MVQVLRNVTYVGQLVSGQQGNHCILPLPIQLCTINLVGEESMLDMTKAKIGGCENITKSLCDDLWISGLF